MRFWAKPRFWIALLAAIAGGAIVCLRCPIPRESVRLSKEEVEQTYCCFDLQAVLSNGQFLVADRRPYANQLEILIIDGRKHEEAPKATCIWDRERGWEQPTIRHDDIVHTIWGGRFRRVVCSPDETRIAMIDWWEAKNEFFPNCHVQLFDLATGRVGDKRELNIDHVFFSPDGKLLDVHDRVLREIENDRELRRMPEKLDGFTFYRTESDFAVYVKDDVMRYYSWHSGELAATHERPWRHRYWCQLSCDGQVLMSSNLIRSSKFPDSKLHITDAATGERRVFDNDWATLSPDGDYLAVFSEVNRPEWITKWWPAMENYHVARFTNWKTDEHVGSVSHASNVVFSPQGNLLAVVRDDGVIDIYDFPFCTPWLTIAGVAILAAGSSWSIGWLWGRWRRKSQ